MQLLVILRKALHPLAPAIGIGSADIKRIVANRDLRPFHLRVAQGIVPIIQVMELHPLAWDDQGGLFARTGKRFHHEILIVADMPMGALPKALQTEKIGVAWTLPKGLMHFLVVHLVGIGAELLIEVWKWTDRQTFRVHRLGYRKQLLSGLRVSAQVVNELGIGRPKQPLNDRAEPGFAPWPCLFRAGVASQQPLKVHAVELWPAIYHNQLREALIAAHTGAQSHHARTVGRGIK